MAVGQLLEIFPSPARYFKLTDLHLTVAMSKKIKLDVKLVVSFDVPLFLNV